MADSSSMESSDESENEKLLGSGKKKTKQISGKQRGQASNFSKMLASNDDVAAAAAADPLTMGSLEDQLREMPGSHHRETRRQSLTRRGSMTRGSNFDSGVGGGRRESRLQGGAGRRGSRRTSIHLPGSVSNISTLILGHLVDSANMFPGVGWPGSWRTWQEKEEN